MIPILILSLRKPDVAAMAERPQWPTWLTTVVFFGVGLYGGAFQAGVGIIMIVYLPILTLTGTEGRMFRPMAWTVVFALAGSMLISLAVMPVLASVAFRKGIAERETRVISFLRRIYRPTLSWKPQGIKGLVDVVNNPMYATGVGLVLFAARHMDTKKVPAPMRR